ncbi:MAG: hypothetical protein JO264_13205 [Acidisphaera sp.]|nr:hypothetical protein [Acidisphaera sp.]
MLPLIPLALTVAPEIGRWLFGSGGGKVADAVSTAVSAVAGTTDPDAVAAIMAGKPELATQLRVQLAQIAAQAEAASRTSELDELKAQLADVGGARSQTVALAQAGSRIAWSPAVLSAIVLLAFATMIYVVLTRTVPEGSAPLANVLLGTLAAMAAQVGNYWLGSSAGSSAKDVQVQQMAEAARTSIPAEIAHKLLPPVATPVPTGASDTRSAEDLNAAELAGIRSPAGGS